MAVLVVKSVDASDLRVGNVLMDDMGKPFAVVATAPTVDGGEVMVNTMIVPDGTFDVRTFSSDHRYMQRFGLASITTWPTYAHAVAGAERAMRMRTEEERETWRQYSTVYYEGSMVRASAATLEEYMPVVFPVRTVASIAWME